MTIQDKGNTPPTAQTMSGQGALGKDSDREWLRRGQLAYDASASYVDTNYRKSWEDSIRAFNSQHTSDSKYSQPAYEKRSRLYRPKTRAVIRKNEAAAAAAFFSNMDVTSITATDQTNKMEVASAEIMKELLQYRLTKSIPWYLTVLGGLQDAQTVGVVCAHIYWDYKSAKAPVAQQSMDSEPVVVDEENPAQKDLPKGAFTLGGGDQPVEPEEPVQAQQMPVQKPIRDKPCIRLIPAENLRVDSGADWTDPINSSPFVIELMPMYVMDVKSRMESGEWDSYSDGTIRNAVDSRSDSTRMARQKNREDPYSASDKAVEDYEIVWVQRHIHRRDDEEWEFYMLGTEVLLTTPRLLMETVFHGERPYVMGCCVIETHKIYPSSIPQLGSGLQEEANEIANQRIDNVKFVLNKKWFVKRGADADIGGLVRNVPGGVVMLQNPTEDVREITWPDVTQSAYEEQSRIDNDMNDLLGNFSPAQVMADHGINGPARNMAMLSQSSGTLVEYLLRTYVETFVVPVLRQLVKLEQKYETDQTILSIAAKKANLLQKYGQNEITDEMLDQELTLTVNVGMGATDPQMKLQKLILGLKSYIEMLKVGVPGLNMPEIGKEIFGHLGYSDGSRFFTTDNPQILQMQQQVQQLQKTIQELEAKVKDKSMGHIVKVKTAEMGNQTKLAVTKVEQDNENLRNAVTHTHAIVEAEKDRTHQLHVSNLDRAHQRVQSPMREFKG